MYFSANSPRFAKYSVRVTMAGITVIGAGPPKWTETQGGDLMEGTSPIALGKINGLIKSEIEIPLIPEMADAVYQRMGTGYTSRAWPIMVQLYERGNPAGIYTISNDACWFNSNAFDPAESGAITTIKATGQDVTNWNGVTMVDVAGLGDPASVGALFASVGLSI